MDKKGLSQIVGAAVLIAMTLIAATILATSTTKFTREELDKSQGCFELFDKIRINDEYTCYNLTGKVMQVSILREDVDVESILVAVRTETSSSNFRLDSVNRTIPLVQNYPNNSTGVEMPKNQSAKTYLVEGVLTFPTKVEIAPKTEKTQCQVLDSLETIPVC